MKGGPELVLSSLFLFRREREGEHSGEPLGVSRQAHDAWHVVGQPVEQACPVHVFNPVVTFDFAQDGPHIAF